MKIRELLELDKTTLSFEVFPPKKDMDFANVEKAAFGIAQLQPSYMSVTCSYDSTSYMCMCNKREHRAGTFTDEGGWD